MGGNHGPVSYTHLDVYKRQVVDIGKGREVPGPREQLGIEARALVLGRQDHQGVIDVYKRQE